jgi:hypothetical protein
MNEKKSSVDEVRQRFDNDVDRFSSIETGQTATIDTSLAMELITKAAFSSTKRVQIVLEVAIAAHVECIITGNQIHFPSELCQGVTVLSRGEFLAFYKNRHIIG